MKYCKVKANGQVGEVRIQLKDHVVVRFQNGDTEKIARSEVEELELAP
jgi:hypothetical protein